MLGGVEGVGFRPTFLWAIVKVITDQFEEVIAVSGEKVRVFAK